MRLGIRFTDNDYSQLVQAFFELYVVPTYRNIEVAMVTDLTTEQVVELFNRYVPFLNRYLAWRDQTWEARPIILDMPIAEWQRLHFRIEAWHVYWDGATDQYLNAWEDWNNSEFTWTDGTQVYTS